MPNYNYDMASSKLAVKRIRRLRWMTITVLGLLVSLTTITPARPVAYAQPDQPQPPSVPIFAPNGVVRTTSTPANRPLGLADIPTITLRTRPSRVRDVTRELSEPARTAIRELANRPSTIAGTSSPTHCTGRCYFGPTPGGDDLVYYDVGADRFITGFDPVDDLAPGAVGGVTITDAHPTAHGHLIYQVSENNLSREARSVLVIADLNSESKLVISNGALALLSWDLNKEGTVIILSLGDNLNYETYTVDLVDMKVRYHFTGTYTNIIVSDDAETLFDGVNVYSARTGKIQRRVDWHSDLSHYPPYVASSDFQFIAATLAMFPSDRYTEGQWGIEIFTPYGFFIISSPYWSMVPQFVGNDGTLRTRRGDVFQFEEGAYRVVAFGARDDIPVHIERFGIPQHGGPIPDTPIRRR